MRFFHLARNMSSKKISSLLVLPNSLILLDNYHFLNNFYFIYFFPTKLISVDINLFFLKFVNGPESWILRKTSEKRIRMYMYDYFISIWISDESYLYMFRKRAIKHTRFMCTLLDLIILSHKLYLQWKTLPALKLSGTKMLHQNCQSGTANGHCWSSDGHISSGSCHTTLKMIDMTLSVHATWSCE